jgi:two-component system copper resistance phosphate regulon response regulator CusR
MRNIARRAKGETDMRLLLVEDEEKTSSYINRALSELGFTVDIAANGTEGLYLALEYDYDEIVLDAGPAGQQTDSRLDVICAWFRG